MRSVGQSSSTADEGSRGTVLTETEHGSDSVPPESPTPDGQVMLPYRWGFSGRRGMRPNDNDK